MPRSTTSTPYDTRRRRSACKLGGIRPECHGTPLAGRYADRFILVRNIVGFPPYTRAFRRYIIRNDLSTDFARELPTEYF